MKQTGAVSLKTVTTSIGGDGRPQVQSGLTRSSPAMVKVQPRLPMKSPIQQASLNVINTMSPRDAVISTIKTADNGIKGYYVQSTDQNI